MILRFFTICGLAICLLSGCNATPPWSSWMEKGPPPGRDYSPLYVEGWKHGCHTGISSSANQWYKMHYGFQQDPILAQDPIYYKGWKDSYDYCSRYIHQRNRQGFF